MNIILLLLLLIGAISLIYYGIIVSYAGIGASFSWVWFMVGIGCILLCFTIWYMMKHEIILARMLRISLLVIVIMAFGVFALLEGMIIYHGNQKADPGMDYIIVLGAQVRGTRITKSLQKRLDTAITYLSENQNTKVIVSGGQGQGEDISEAQAMEMYLAENGIDEKRIIKEDKSTNTNENIRYSKMIMPEEAGKVAIVTNSFHVFRAIKIARKQGLPHVQGISAPSDPILLVNYYVREVLGVIKDKMAGNL